MTRMVTEAVLNLIGLDPENVSLLAEQKIIPCTVEEFRGITIQDENFRNFNTLEWNEDDTVKSWYFGDMLMSVTSYDKETGWVTESPAGTNLGRRDKFTTAGAQYYTEIYTDKETVAIFKVEFNEHGVPVEIARRHVNVERIGGSDDEPELKLNAGHQSVEYNKLDKTGKFILRRVDAEGEVLETFEYDEDDRIKHITNGINHTEFEYTEYGHVKCVTSWISGEGVLEMKTQETDDQREISNVSIEYNLEIPGRIETVSVGRDIIMSFTSYWRNKKQKLAIEM
ncbi:hypothetical protein SM033_00133 [Vibrio phage vB_VpaM_sm033]|nr:hypothetical protein SM033_00133 [Vibrio phage vB_VpaM_sm033]